MNEGVKYLATLEALKGNPDALTALISLSEGYPIVGGAERNYYDLEQCGLVVPFSVRAIRARAAKQSTPIGDEISDYGRAFVAWYMQPRDIPQQLSLFDD